MDGTCVIRSAADMDRMAVDWGFLPFFRCAVPGLSVEEMTAPEYWFSDEDEGPWEWKGPVIREGHAAYGKFFARKAGYVSLRWLPHLMNYRRSLRYAKDDDTAALDDVVMQTIAAEGGVTVKELRRHLGLSPRRGRRREADLVDSAPMETKLSLEPILTRLMMGLRVVISDFEYNVDRHGRPYGWGVARYVIPETLYGRLDARCSPEESYRRIYDYLREKLPLAAEESLRALIG